MANNENILIRPGLIRAEFTKHVYTHEYKVRSSYHPGESETPYQILSSSIVDGGSSTEKEKEKDNSKLNATRGTIQSHKERYLKDADENQKIMLNKKHEKKNANDKL